MRLSPQLPTPGFTSGPRIDSLRNQAPGRTDTEPTGPPTPRDYTRLKIELWSVPVLSAKPSSSTPRDRRMLRYMLDIRVSPSRQ